MTFIGQFYMHQNHLKPKEILVPVNIDAAGLEQMLEVRVHQPQKGRKKELVDLAEQNAKIALDEKFALIEKEQERTIHAVEQLGDYLNIPAPRRIETFDNSNIQGVNPVSAMVVFEDGKPNKKLYRKYKIKTVEGPDDYATMKEVIRRRYSRLLKENAALPDMILVDGGKGQLSAAQDVLTNELGLTILVCGLVKDDKHKTSDLLLGDPPEMVKLPRNGQAFYLLQRIQDEVHRFAISFHRQIRDQSMSKSILDDVPGIGPKRKQTLLKAFGSVKKMKEASLQELIHAGLPKNTAEGLQKYFLEND